MSALAGTKRRSNEWWWLKQGYKKGPNGEWIAPSDTPDMPEVASTGGGSGGDNPPDAPGASASLPSDYMPDGGLKFKEV